MTNYASLMAGDRRRRRGPELSGDRGDVSDVMKDLEDAQPARARRRQLRRAKALRAVGKYVRDHGATVSAFYLSNVEQYLHAGRHLGDVLRERGHDAARRDEHVHPVGPGRIRAAVAEADCATSSGSMQTETRGLRGRHSASSGAPPASPARRMTTRRALLAGLPRRRWPRRGARSARRPRRRGHRRCRRGSPTRSSGVWFRQFSEPGGTFHSDNFVSNEGRFQIVHSGTRTARATPGGLYIGVGPEQNFTYIAAVRPRMAFIIDIRRGNLHEHLLYKALMEMSADRAELSVALVFARAACRPDARDVRPGSVRGLRCPAGDRCELPTQPRRGHRVADDEARGCRSRPRTSRASTTSTGPRSSPTVPISGYQPDRVRAGTVNIRPTRT